MTAFRPISEAAHSWSYDTRACELEHARAFCHVRLCGFNLKLFRLAYDHWRLTVYILALYKFCM